MENGHLVVDLPIKNGDFPYVKYIYIYLFIYLVIFHISIVSYVVEHVFR